MNLVDSSLETHPYPSFIPDNIKVLFVGSFPPVKLTRKYIDSNDSLISLYNRYLVKHPKTSKDIDYYYGSVRNYFWKLLSLILECELDSRKNIEKRLSFFNIGVTDVAEVCIRKLIDKETGKKVPPSSLTKPVELYSVSSSDSCLIIKKSRKLHNYIYSKPTLNSIVFTGSFAYRNFLKFLPGNLSISNDTIFLENGRMVNLYLLPSPSGSANKSIGACSEYKLKKDRDPLYNTFLFRKEKYKQLLDHLLG